MAPTNRYGHIDLRVSDMSLALPFYKKFLPHVGFGQFRDDGDWKMFSTAGELPAAPLVAIIEQTDHKANENRIAFWADSREEVDRMSGMIKEAGGRNISGPRACLDYSKTYYAVFFEDPCGNGLEVYFRTD